MEYVVTIEKRANDDERPLKVTVTNKRNRKDSDYVISKDPGLIGCKMDLVPTFNEYFDKRIILHMKSVDGVELINYVAISNIANNPNRNYSSISAASISGSSIEGGR